MSLYLILAIVVTHYIFDWVLQTQEMSLNKYKCNKALGRHVAVYTSGLVLLALFSPLSIWWALFNGFVHFWVDYTTSKMTHNYYEKGKMKSFWNTIGADQMIHYIILFVTSSF